MMRTQVKNIAGVITSCIPQRFLIKLTGQNLILPFYHAVSDESLPHIRHLYKIRDITSFSRDLNFFLRYYQPVSLSDLPAMLKGKKRPAKPSVAVSFDDGLREVYDIVAPLLIQRGVPATIFINTAFVGNRALFFKYKASLIVDRLEKVNHPGSLYEIINARLGTSITRKSEMIRKILNITFEQKDLLDSIAEVLDIDFNTFLKIRKPYMTIEQIGELQKKGFQIGSHSIDHPLFSTLTSDEQIRQVKESSQWINDHFHPDHRFFSFPFIDDGVNKDFFYTITNPEARLIDLSFGSSGLKKAKYPFHLQRIPVEKSGLGAKYSIRGEYVYFIIRSLALSAEC